MCLEVPHYAYSPSSCDVSQLVYQVLKGLPTTYVDADKVCHCYQDCGDRSRSIESVPRRLDSEVDEDH